jgi:hypothetical protein
MKTEGAIAKKKWPLRELMFMKAFTQTWELLSELPIVKKCCFHFLIRTTTKTPYGDIP